MGSKCCVTVNLGVLFEASRIVLIGVWLATSVIWGIGIYMCMVDLRYHERSIFQLVKKFCSCLNGILITVLNSFLNRLPYMEAVLFSHLCFYKFSHKTPCEHFLHYSVTCFIWLCPINSKFKAKMCFMLFMLQVYLIVYNLLDNLRYVQKVSCY